ncbi:MAG: mannose-1-phosphate guanylyltransferase, partial [Epulopiscium sp. Nele67-Bin002]
ADHLVKNKQIYEKTLKAAIEKATEEANIVTIGIVPSYAETGYGYIKFKAASDNIYKVEKFVEKPDLELAKEYLATGEYLWNSGMFIWKLSTIWEKFMVLLPDIYKGMELILDSIGTDNEADVLAKQYSMFKAESIDYGIMERSDNIFTIVGAFGWDDVGSWLALERINQTDSCANVISGNVVTCGVSASIVCGGDRLIAMVGVADLVVVDCDDVILICDKASTSDVKVVIDKLKSAGKQQYL